MRKTAVLFVALALYALPLIAQTVADAQYVHTIHLGTFPEVMPRDFDQVRTMGFVYSQPVGRMVDVFLGGWDNEEAPRALLPTLRNMGYSASVRKLPVEQGQPVRVIQLGAERVTGPIAWEKYFAADQLNVLIANDVVKILAGPYDDETRLRADLAAFRKKGFPQAFAKTVNSALLHAVTSFETGGVKRPAFDIQLPKSGERSGKPTGEPEPMTYDAPVTYDLPAASVEGTAKSGGPTRYEAGAGLRVPVPEVRSNVKRSSARHLQETLKELGYLAAGIDGYYGRMTASAFEKAWAEHRQVQKYKVLSRTALFAERQADELPLQRAIDLLGTDPAAAVPLLQRSTRPEAKAWLAYRLFVTQGPSPEVDRLMNEAIRAAFVGVDPSRFPSFDYRARYSYPELAQLLRHLFYVQVAAPKDRLALPCWLLQRHGKVMESVLTDPVAQRNEWYLSGCEDAGGWEYVRVLRTIMQDISAGQTGSAAERRAAASEWVRLLLLPATVADSEVKDAPAWTGRLATSVDGWGLRDPMLGEIAQAWKLAWYQSCVLLEDWFMDKGLSPEAARQHAAAALRALAQPWMKRFL